MCFQRSGNGQYLLLIEFSIGIGFSEFQFAFGQGAGFVERSIHRSGLCASSTCPLVIRKALSSQCCIGCSQCGRCGQRQRARTGDDQYGEHDRKGFEPVPEGTSRVQSVKRQSGRKPTKPYWRYDLPSRPFWVCKTGHYPAVEQSQRPGCFLVVP